MSVSVCIKSSALHPFGMPNIPLLHIARPNMYHYSNMLIRPSSIMPPMKSITTAARNFTARTLRWQLRNPVVPWIINASAFFYVVFSSRPWTATQWIHTCRFLYRNRPEWKLVIITHLYTIIVLYSARQTRYRSSKKPLLFCQCVNEKRLKCARSVWMAASCQVPWASINSCTLSGWSSTRQALLLRRLVRPHQPPCQLCGKQYL